MCGPRTAGYTPEERASTRPDLELWWLTCVNCARHASRLPRTMSPRCNMVEWLNRNGRAVVFLCNLSVVVLAVLAVLLYLRPWSAIISPAAPAIGSRFALSPGGSSDSRAVLYLAISTRCGACEREADSYRSLEQDTDVEQGVRVVYLMSEGEAAGRSFLNRHGLRSQVGFGTRFKGSGIREFPTVVLVDRQNIVQFWHVGALRDKDRQRLEAALLRCSACSVGDGKVFSGR